MALLSRSSLRGSVRRAPEEPADGLAPPTKKQRIQENGPDRRKSSPDCLDTSREDTPTAKPRSNPLKHPRPRTSTRHTRRDSSSSIDTVASAAGQLTTPTTHTNGNGIFKTPRARRGPGTPSGTVADLLRDLHESPDPLDTISPAPPSIAPKQRTITPAVISEADAKPPSSPVTRPTCRNDNRSLADADADDEKATTEEIAVEHGTSTQDRKSEVPEGEQPASVETGTGRRSLRSADTGSRSKSELAQYFHNYEQIISLEEPPPGRSFCP